MLRQVSERLWLGSFPNLKMIEDCGATAVLCTVKKWSPFSVIDAVDRWAGFPIPDGKRWDEDLFRRAADTVEQWLDKGRTVLVHCHAGRNRSAAVCAIVLIREGRDPQEVVNHIRAIRPRAIANPVFEERLLKGAL